MSPSPVALPITGPEAPPWRFARFLRAYVGPALLAVYRTRCSGAEHVPVTGGFILAGNHASNLDPPLLWAASPRGLHFLAKQELFDNPLLRWAYSRVWAIPIRRGAADRLAIGRATALLEAGDAVGIFPEGTRQLPDAPVDESAEAHAGVAFIAMRAGVPVVPVGIAGTDRALPKGALLPRFPRVTVCYGEPIRPEEFTEGGRKERMKAMTAEIMRRIAVAHASAEKE